MPINIYHPLTVLLAEDNYDDARLSLRALRACGLPLLVRVARDGAEALRLLGLGDGVGTGPPLVPDLILSDLKMPKVGGDRLLERVRADERLGGVPFVVFSSSDDSGDVQRCRELGASAYVVKPVGYEEFIACTGRIAQRWLASEGRSREPFCVLDEPERGARIPAGMR